VAGADGQVRLVVLQRVPHPVAVADLQGDAGFRLAVANGGEEAGDDVLPGVVTAARRSWPRSGSRASIVAALPVSRRASTWRA